MKILFIHPNFPAQFRFLAAALGANPDNHVIYATKNPRPEWPINGVTKAVFTVDERCSPWMIRRFLTTGYCGRSKPR